jgi:hypothetical protein
MIFNYSPRLDIFQILIPCSYITLQLNLCFPQNADERDQFIELLSDELLLEPEPKRRAGRA